MPASLIENLQKYRPPTSDALSPDKITTMAGLESGMLEMDVAALSQFLGVITVATNV